MNAQKVVIGTVIGAIVLFVLGQLIFDMALDSYYMAHMGAAQGAVKEPPLYWAIILGNIGEGLLLTLWLLKKPGDLTWSKGLVSGAILGFLVWFIADFTHFGLTNLWQLTVAIIDPFAEAVHFGISGAILAVVLAKMSKPVPA